MQHATEALEQAIVQMTVTNMQAGLLPTAFAQMGELQKQLGAAHQQMEALRKTIESNEAELTKLRAENAAMKVPAPLADSEGGEAS